ncbi:hypothetical protein ABI59_21495 [Acidobacteria bacterium Mor1]|nr:hypothetical protein ABI59_21495 [Acidobacteria bacterium Mor1]
MLLEPVGLHVADLLAPRGPFDQLSKFGVPERFQCNLRRHRSQACLGETALEPLVRNRARVDSDDQCKALRSSSRENPINLLRHPRAGLFGVVQQDHGLAETLRQPGCQLLVLAVPLSATGLLDRHPATGGLGAEPTQ